MKRNRFLSALALMLTAIIFTSCSKKQERYDTTFSEDNALAENIFKNVSGIADEAYEVSSNGLKSGIASNYYLSECVDVTLDLSSDPYSLLVDFGNTNCLCNDGRNRRGKILLTFNGIYRDPGTVITISFDEYFVDDYKVDGSMKLHNTGLNENDHLQYNVEVNGLVVKPENEGTITWKSNRTHQWIEGVETFTVGDDVYLISGTATGTSSQKINGSTTSMIQYWDIETTKALRVQLNCKWIVSGTMTLIIDDWPEVLLDYGDGDCDRVATAEIDDQVYTIYLRE